MAKQYGITVTSKDGTREATEWFGSEIERDQFFSWYKAHGRKVVYAQREDERAARRELEAQRQHELAVARARAGRAFVDNRSSGMATGLALGVAAGLLF